MRNTGLQLQIRLEGKEKEGCSSLLPASFDECASLKMLLAKCILTLASSYVTSLKMGFILSDVAAKNSLSICDDQYIKKVYI